MVDDLRAARTVVAAIFRAKLKNRKGFVLNLIVNSLDVITPALAFVALTHTFGNLGGWNVGEVLLLLGCTNACLALSLFVMGAFDSFLFMPIFRSGQLESALLRPGNTVLFLAASNVRPYRLGRVVTSIGIAVVGGLLAGSLPWSIVLVMPLYLVLGAVMLSAFWFFDAAASVRLGQQNDMTRSMPFVGTEMSFFPHGLYPPTGRFIAQFVFGVGAATYLPLSFLMDKGPNLGPWSFLAAPIVTVILVWLAHRIWTSAIHRWELKGAM